MQKGKSIKEYCLWMLAGLYIILPIYFSFEISSAFPSFTGSRLILIFTFFILVIVKKKVMFPKVFPMKVVFFFSIIIIICNIIHFQNLGMYVVKEILSITIEIVVLIVLINNYIDSMKDLDLFIHVKTDNFDISYICVNRKCLVNLKCKCVFKFN